MKDLQPRVSQAFLGPPGVASGLLSETINKRSEWGFATRLKRVNVSKGFASTGVITPWRANLPTELVGNKV